MVYPRPREVLRIFEWEGALRVWLAGDVHCLAPWVVPTGGCGFGLVKGLKHLSKGILTKAGPKLPVLSALTE